MKYKKEIKESARDGAVEAFLYYEGKQDGLGDTFLDAMETLINRIVADPKLFQIRVKTFRQAIIKPFPYLIIFEIEQETVIVYKVILAKKHPKKFYKK